MEQQLAALTVTAQALILDDSVDDEELDEDAGGATDLVPPPLEHARADRHTTSPGADVDEMTR